MSLPAVWREIDGLFARARDRHADALACRSGCANCCVTGIVVSPAEAAIVRAHLAAAGAAERERVARLVGRSESGSCPALDEEMACSIYAARPLVCRTFGLPHRIASHEPPPAAEGRRRLPLLSAPDPAGRVVDTCYKNFIGVPAALVDPGCVVDQASLRARLNAIPGAAPGPDAVLLGALLRAELGLPPE